MTSDDPLTDREEPPDDSRAYRAGEKIAVAARKPFAVLLVFGLGLLRFMPKKQTVYRGMIKKGYEQLWKQTSAHVVVNTIYGDGAVVPRPAQVETDQSRVETDNEESWTAENGVETVRIGNAPVATGAADDHELVDHISARIAEAVDYSPRRLQPVDETADGYIPIQFQGPLDDLNDGGPTTIADGAGPTANQAALVEQKAQELLEDLLPRQCTFSDVWLDASNPEPENDGWIVSMRKAYDLHWDQAASEEMQNQEMRGRLAEMDPEKGKYREMKMALIAIGCFALGLFGPALASQIAGTAGSTGGGISVPLAVGTILGVI